MKRSAAVFVCFLACVLSSLAQTNTSLASVRYTLLDGSYFIDDCPVCGRPTIIQPMRGTFDLVLLQDTPPVIRYALRNVAFTASAGTPYEIQIAGNGTYQLFQEFANLQDMKLAVHVKNALTNRFAFFTNQTPVPPVPWPRIQANLQETNGTLLQTFSMKIVAAPAREVWFSINRNLTNSAGILTAGDLLSNRGRVVKRNIDLVGRLGVMPIVPDLGLDAVDVTRRGEILFSIPANVFSETLGPIQHGDLLSNLGKIVKRNQALLAAFGTSLAAPDAGLDAVQVVPDGEILFSIRSNVAVSAALTLFDGDILSDKGYVFRTQKQLLANFHPAVANLDFGLDAMHVLPNGEIWFSVERGFTDNLLGPILPGDVLSDRGHRVFRNSDLVSAFKPSAPTLDYGCDALYVVTDTKAPAPTPRLIGINRVGPSNLMRIQWDGDGSVFELERAPDLMGPWEPCSPLLPDLSYDDDCSLTNKQFFYRLRQW